MTGMTEFRYIVNKNLGVRACHDSDMGFGTGLTFNLDLNRGCLKSPPPLSDFCLTDFVI